MLMMIMMMIIISFFSSRQMLLYGNMVLLTYLHSPANLSQLIHLLIR